MPPSWDELRRKMKDLPHAIEPELPDAERPCPECGSEMAWMWCQNADCDMGELTSVEDDEGFVDVVEECDECGGRGIVEWCTKRGCGFQTSDEFWR